MTDEDARAAAWRAQQVRRAQAVRANAIRLRGSPSARKRLEQRWEPVINRTKTTDATGSEGTT
jgi:hypothetical protein